MSLDILYLGIPALITLAVIVYEAFKESRMRPPRLKEAIRKDRKGFD